MPNAPRSCVIFSKNSRLVRSFMSCSLLRRPDRVDDKVSLLLILDECEQICVNLTFMRRKHAMRARRASPSVRHISAIGFRLREVEIRHLPWRQKCRCLVTQVRTLRKIPRPRLHQGFTSKMTSSSTGEPSGTLATPNTSAKRRLFAEDISNHLRSRIGDLRVLSDSGVAATYTTSLTTWLTRCNEPNCFSVSASILSAAKRRWRIGQMNAEPGETVLAGGCVCGHDESSFQLPA